jgi:hypothetical protein
MDEISCPHCRRTERQLKIGRNPAGSQRYLCFFRQRKYTAQPKPRGYSEEQRRLAPQWYVDGMSLRRIARRLGLVHQTVANWVSARVATLPDIPPAPPHDAQRPLAVVELDELSGWNLRLLKRPWIDNLSYISALWIHRQLAQVSAWWGQTIGD